MNAMLGIMNIILYLIAAGLGFRAMWALHEDNRFYAGVTFGSSLVCLFKVILYIAYLDGQLFEALGVKEDFQWAAAHALTALFFAGFHIMTMQNAANENGVQKKG